MTNIEARDRGRHFAIARCPLYSSRTNLLPVFDLSPLPPRLASFPPGRIPTRLTYPLQRPRHLSHLKSYAPPSWTCFARTPNQESTHSLLATAWSG